MPIDTLTGKIATMRNPTVAGLDPRIEYIPDDIMSRHISEKGETLLAAADAFLEFNKGLVDALCDIVPAVKLQSACYEMLGIHGISALMESAAYAGSKGMYVILDCKRGDIGSTAEAYSAAYLGRVTVGSVSHSPFFCDALTVNPYLGSDGLKPFIKDCAAYGKSIFVLVKTSNPSSVELQDLIAGDRHLYKSVAELVRNLGLDSVGGTGYSAVGAVIGATHPKQLKELRTYLPNTFFLVPGYGAQGGDAYDIAPAFKRDGSGAIINSSRAIMCAWKKNAGMPFGDAARAEALRMSAEIKKVVPALA